MKCYFVVPDKTRIPDEELLQDLKKVIEYEIIFYKGSLKDVKKLTSENEEKILAVDPDSFDWDLDVDSLNSIPSIKAVITGTTSFDWIKPDALKKLNIKGCNVPGFSNDSVTEYALAMTIDVSRKLPLIIKNNWKIDWEKDPPMLLNGKTVGIIGLGKIGKEMAELYSGIGMNVIYWSKNSSDKRYRKVELSKLFEESDVIVPALVENSDTKKLLSRDMFDLMKKSAVLVGINRVKSIWDEDYIFQKVKKGEISGYAFEGDNAKSIKEYDGNVLALPPMAWYTKDSLDNLMKIWIDTIIAFAKNKPINIIN